MDLHLKARIDTIDERCSVQKHEFGYAGILCKKKKKKRFPMLDRGRGSVVILKSRYCRPNHGSVQTVSEARFSIVIAKKP